MRDEDKFNLANQISQIISFDEININEVDLRDFVLNQNNNFYEIIKNLTPEERQKSAKMSNTEYNQFLRLILSEEQINEVVNQFSEPHILFY